MKPIFKLLFAFVPVLTAVSCKVDSEYDFSKLDTTVTVLKGVSFPVPNAQILLNDIFSLDDSEYIIYEADGDYHIHLEMVPFDIPVSFPESDLDLVPVDYDPVRFEFGNLSDFLSEEIGSVALDLSGMKVDMEVGSDIPAELSINTTLESVRDGVVDRQCQIENLTIRYGNRKYTFVENLNNSESGNYVEIPELSKLLFPIPDLIQFGSLEVYADARQRALIDPYELYDLSFGVTVDSPIRFAEGTRLNLSLPLDAKLDLDEIGLKKAVLNMVMDNSIPLDFSIKMSAYGMDGQKLESVQITPGFDVIPASSRTEGSITLTTDGDLRFSSLVLDLTASFPAAPASSANLNRNQGLKLSGMSLYLPDGIQVKLDSSTKNK